MNTAIVVFGLLSAIPIIAILAAHQQKMAEIMGAQRNRSVDADVIARLSAEVSELRQLYAEQAIALDDLKTVHGRLLERSSDTQSVQQRLGG